MRLEVMIGLKVAETAIVLGGFWSCGMRKWFVLWYIQFTVNASLAAVLAGKFTWLTDLYYDQQH